MLCRFSAGEPGANGCQAEIHCPRGQRSGLRYPSSIGSEILTGNTNLVDRETRRHSAYKPLIRKEDNYVIVKCRSFPGWRTSKNNSIFRIVLQITLRSVWALDSVWLVFGAPVAHRKWSVKITTLARARGFPVNITGV